MKMKCEIIRDLVPSYIDGLTSRESNELIEEHLEECGACREYLDEMKEDIAGENQPVKNKEAVKPFRKLRQKTRRKIFLTAGGAVLACGLPENVRGERLSIQDFSALSKALREMEG